MNIDVSKLSRGELLELRKSINDALDGGDYITYKTEEQYSPCQIGLRKCHRDNS